MALTDAEMEALLANVPDDEDEDDGQDDEGTPAPKAKRRAADDDGEDDEEDESADDGVGKVKAKLSQEVVKWRRRAQGKDEAWNERQGRTKTNGTPPATANGNGKAPGIDELRAQIRAEVEGEFATKAQDSMVEKEAVTALVTAGLALPEDPKAQRRVVKKVVRLLDLDSVAVDGDEIEGLDDAIEELKADHPGLFKTAAGNGNGQSGSRRGRKVTGERRGPVGERDALDILAEKIFGERS